MLRACRVIEGAGVRSVAIVSTGFLRQARATARALGIADVAIVEYPGVIPNDSDQVFLRKVQEQVVPAVLEALGIDD